jgi:hypothetical protein
MALFFLPYNAAEQRKKNSNRLGGVKRLSESPAFSEQHREVLGQVIGCLFGQAKMNVKKNTA